MPVLHITASSPDDRHHLPIAALLDHCSNRTFCTPELLKRLQVKPTPAPMQLDLAGAPGRQVQAEVAALSISNPNDRTVVRLPRVYAMEGLPTGLQYATSREAEHYPHLRTLPLPPSSDRPVNMILGIDSHQALRPIALALGAPNEPYAMQTRLGWAMVGPVPAEAACFLALAPQDPLLERVEKFWALESSGLYDNIKAASVNDRRVQALWDQEIKQIEGHYQLPIPFRHGHPQLPDSFHLAAKRLRHLARRLQQNEALAQQYHQGIQTLLDRGYAEPAPAKSSHEPDTWYIPHHPVIHPRKQKPRIVFDCAAKVAGISLNDAVHTGPDLANALVGVLLRFRQHKVAVTADVEAMFHQVRVPPNQRDVLRFLWYPGGDTTRAPTEYRMTSHLFGGTWSPSACINALRRTAQEYGHEYHPETAKTVERHFYVDDCLRSVPSLDEARALTQQLPQLLDRGGFNLAKWTSNDPAALSRVPKDKLGSSSTRTMPGAPADEQALGVYWDTDSDAFCFNATLPEHRRTRRGLLSALSTIYDPLGLVGPLLIEARHAVQQLCRLNLRWDDAIPEEIAERWEAWLTSLDTVSQLRFPRCLVPGLLGSLPTLHHFSDASQTAYGVTSYLRYMGHDARVHSILVMAKSRLAPMKPCTIPRLELCAATLATRQDELLKRELDLPLGRSVFWVDSTTVLQYVFNAERRYLTFVANRVGEIRERTKPKDWRYVPTDQNPADDTTRPTDPATLGEERWQRGPTFLRRPPDAWPERLVPPPLDDDDIELRVAATCCAQEPRRRLDFLDGLVEHYSSYPKMIRVLSRVIAALHHAARKGPHPAQLQPWQVLHAERLVWEHAQERHYRRELHALERGQPLPQDSPLSRLAPVLRRGMLLSEGRLRHASIPEAAKYPIILPARHPAVVALLRDLHEFHGHCGYRQTVAEAWNRYWIVGVAVAAKKIVRECVVCRRRDARPAQQRMADLPPDRVTTGKAAFTNVGVDYFGPIVVKVGRRNEKRYGCLFTCLQTRAVHVEVAHTLDTSSFLMALDRFFSRRGLPEIIRSDNGRNFVGGERELRDILEGWNQTRISNALAPRRVTWLFNPPLASHMGGVWERQIRTVRRLFAGLSGGQRLTDEALHTLLVVAEGIVNNRPLTELSGDVGELGVLTPNHLLLLRDTACPTPPATPDLPPAKQRWRQIQHLADEFWRRWMREYLPLLRARTKWRDARPNVKVGDIVLVADANAPRSVWPLARVVETVPGPDHLVRMARVRTAKGIALRPVSKLVVLEGVSA